MATDTTHAIKKSAPPMSKSDIEKQKKIDAQFGKQKSTKKKK